MHPSKLPRATADVTVRGPNDRHRTGPVTARWTDARLGRLLPDGGVEFVRHLPHAPEKVWRALTESEHLAHWFPTDIVGERRVGAALELPFWPKNVERWKIEQPVTHGELVTWEPPTLFEWVLEEQYAALVRPVSL